MILFDQPNVSARLNAKDWDIREIKDILHIELGFGVTLRLSISYEGGTHQV